MKKVKTQQNIHDFYMAQALSQAKVAFRKGEVPIGAVVVDASGTIVGRGYNQVEAKKCQTAHAESIAIQKACKKRYDWRLDDCTLYVTLEPCLMCLGLIYLSRITVVYFGAKSPLYGYSEYQTKQPHVRSAYKKSIKIVGSLKEHASADILRAFFVQERKKTKEQS